MRDFLKEGNHTFPLIIHYHACPKCGKINEHRSEFEERLGTQVKDLDCERCHHLFSVIKK